MYSVRGPKFRYFALFIAVIAIVVGVYLTFFHSKGFVKTQATIVSIVEEPKIFENDDPTFTVTVDYVADGTHYTSTLDSYSPSYRVGKTIDVLYDPANPAVVHGGSLGFGIYGIAVGVVIIVVVIVSAAKAKQAKTEVEKLRTDRGGALYAPSVKGIDREVYFLTDVGTPKYGHRIESKSRKVLYEAKMTKFSLTSPYGFDFIDHEHNVTTPHLVGHEEESQWDSLLLDNHYTFELDGESIWKHLKRNGVSVETERMEGTIFPRYRVLRDGEEIAIIESSSQFVHEEDAEEHAIMNKVAVPGFYRIWTREENLDVVFVTALAFARTGALNDEGGAYGKQMRGALGKMLGRK